MKSIFLRIVSVAVISGIFSGCSTISEKTRVSSNLNGRIFNSVASTYTERPTFVSIEKMSDGAEVLNISVKRIYKDEYGIEVIENRFLKEHIGDYVALIDKYVEWEALALKRGDIFTKDIGRAKIWGNMSEVELTFAFHSSSANSHYLYLRHCRLGPCNPNSDVVFDLDSAKKLSEMLKDFQSGKLKQADISGVYK